MSELVRETVLVAAPRDAVWALLDDPASLARVLPGAESLVADGPDRWTGVLASRIGFLTIRADVVARLVDVRRPDHMRLDIEGRPRGLAGSFGAGIPFDLAEDGAGTRISYAVDLRVTGRLAAFGLPIMRDTLRKQVAQLVTNLDRELGAG